jgi:hypothetical protein
MFQAHASSKIVVRGSFDVSWTDYVGDMLMHVQVDEGKIRTTTLFGQPIDLAAFLGTLHMLIDLGFPVIAFEYQQADPIESAGEHCANVETTTELRQARPAGN